MNDKDDDMDIFDLVDKASSFWDENKEFIKSVAPDENELVIDDKEPLKTAIVEDDKVLITMEVRGEHLHQINLDLEGTTAKIGIGEKTVTATVPEDTDMDNAQAMLNNGVLEVTLPRTGGDE